MEIVIDNAFIEQYVKRSKRHAAYDKTVKISQHLKFHIDGYDKDATEQNPYFKELIDKRRPSESEQIKAYRREIYSSITKMPCFKVLNSLKKIVKSQDWKIDYSKTKISKSINEAEQPEDYTEEKYPMFRSLENWLYSFSLQQIISDPNGLIYVVPLQYDIKKNEYFKPFSYFAKSENVYDYVQDQYAVIRTDKTADFVDDSGKFAGKEYVILIITTTQIWESRKVNTRGDYLTELKQAHNIGKLPAFRVGGTYSDIVDNAPIYDSFISPILPGLDNATRENSDLDAEVVQHIFSTMWYMAGQDCGACKGTGLVVKAGKQVACTTCEGSGSFIKSPYKDIVIKTSELDQKQVPTPPAGYIQKNVDIVKIQDERVENHVYKALSAINMEYLANTPLNQSGKAKEVDRDELNNFVYGVAYHLVENILKPIYFFVNEYRYSVVVPSLTDREAMLPNIPVPQRFDILTENIVGDQLTIARNAKADPTIINELEIDYVAKKFNNNPDVRDRLLAIKKLDPFPAKDYAQKTSEALAGMISKRDAILSTYINSFVERALNEYPCTEETDTTSKAGFLDMGYADQMKIVMGYAEEKEKDINGKEKIQTAII